MPNKLPPFSALKQHFPALKAAEVKKLIGGNVDADYITNCCTIRTSRALNGAGAPIPKSHPGLTTVRGADGKRYALRVKEFRVYMRETYGPPTLTARGGAVADSFRGVQGIIMFDVRIWSDATGHFDLWDGATCAYEGHWPEAFEVQLWQAPAAASGQRTAGLGMGAAGGLRWTS
jgi:hypothetical protein